MLEIVKAQANTFVNEFAKFAKMMEELTEDEVEEIDAYVEEQINKREDEFRSLKNNKY